MTRSMEAVDLGELSPEILQWAQQARFEFLACRDVGHAWPIDRRSLRWRTDNYQGRRIWVREQKCAHRCGVVRLQRKDFATRERLSTKYVYPLLEDGERSPYLLPPGCSRLSAEDVFDLVQLTVLGEDAEVEPPKKTRRGRKAA